MIFTAVRYSDKVLLCRKFVKYNTTLNSNSAKNVM